MNCQCCNPYFGAQAWAAQEQLLGYNRYALGGAMGDLAAMMDANAKPPRKDLTANQIEWCRTHIPAFMPKVPA